MPPIKLSKLKTSPHLENLQVPIWAMMLMLVQYASAKALKDLLPLRCEAFMLRCIPLVLSYDKLPASMLAWPR